MFVVGNLRRLQGEIKFFLIINTINKVEGSQERWIHLDRI
jgi:hypothetical protein